MKLQWKYALNVNLEKIHYMKVMKKEEEGRILMNMKLKNKNM